MRLRILLLVVGLGVVAAGVALAARDERVSVTPTIGVNGQRLQPDPATYRLTLDGRAVRTGAAPTPLPRGGLVAPGGRYRLDPASAGVVVVNTRTGARRVLAATHLCRDALADPWSPDGRWLAVPVSAPGDGCSAYGPEAAVVEVEQGRLRRVAGVHTTPVTWNRDGSRLLIAVGSSDPFGSSRLVDPRSTAGQAVLPSIGALLAPGAWAPGRRFYAALTRVLRSRSQAVAIVDGSLRRVVALIPAVTPYGLSVRSLRWDRSGRTLSAVLAPLPRHD